MEISITDSTRQNSSQSVGSMPPPPSTFISHVLQIMPSNPKYDQFQSKGHHNEKNPQSTTKMPEKNPHLTCFKIAPKLEKSTNCNLTSYGGGQDTSACKISGHFLNGFSRKCPETPKLTREREREVKFIGLFGDRGHRGPYSPYKPLNHNLYIGIIIFPHIDNPQSTGYN